jgi:hypothetical protein
MAVLDLAGLSPKDQQPGGITRFGRTLGDQLRRQVVLEFFKLHCGRTTPRTRVYKLAWVRQAVPGTRTLGLRPARAGARPVRNP